MTKYNTSVLMSKLKIVQGHQFITIEDTSGLTQEEMMVVIPHLLNQASFDSVQNLTILVHEKFNHGVEQLLKDGGFSLHDEMVIVMKELHDMKEVASTRFDFKNLEQVSTQEFTKVWEKAMQESLNASSSLNIDEHMLSVQKELGDGYRKSCLIAYEDGIPIGIVMPHIEPGTEHEGRLFYFGLIPEERGKLKSTPLHQQALELLKTDFKANYYIGQTSHNNLPMLKTFERNGCRILERNKVYKRKR
ncbi:GNAT family N-acetyltransferase [Rossellomorea aquimaris]|uniref:GNAT family N-acetyltransferase n=1 Tax=Rossellomorea aquimaris TaxID=189382 RepID=UPI001CD199F7|nr:GNAT family N-acetyltransferase [Rossellomorea aquimaris]MCA1054046.1 GNAT family N-acetyltransferase [Rossellomorea aquimaris]